MDEQDFGLEYTYESMTPQEYWNTRQEQFEKSVRSKKFFDSMNYAQREASVRLVQRALELAMDTTDEWLAESFEFDEVGNMIGVHIKLLVADINEAVHDADVITRTSIKRLLKDVIKDKEIREQDGS